MLVQRLGQSVHDTSTDAFAQIKEFDVAEAVKTRNASNLLIGDTQNLRDPRERPADQMARAKPAGAKYLSVRRKILRTSGTSQSRIAPSQVHEFCLNNTEEFVTTVYIQPCVRGHRSRELMFCSTTKDVGTHLSYPCTQLAWPARWHPRNSILFSTSMWKQPQRGAGRGILA